MPVAQPESDQSDLLGVLDDTPPAAEDCAAAPETGSLEAALAAHEAEVDALIKEAARYASALKAWKKACHMGRLADRQKASDQAVRLATALPTLTGAAQWTFDAGAWLRSDAWRTEIADALRALGLGAIKDPSGALLCPPLPLVAEPERSRLRAGRQTFSMLRPTAVAAEIRRVRERVAGARTQEFLEALYAATRHLRGTSDLRAAFREIYNLFSLTPGWKKENTELDFGQMVYALAGSGLQTTKDGKRFELQTPSGKVKSRDIFGVYGEDGRLHEYYAIRFF